MPAWPAINEIAVRSPSRAVPAAAIAGSTAATSAGIVRNGATSSTNRSRSALVAGSAPSIMSRHTSSIGRDRARSVAEYSR